MSFTEWLKTLKLEDRPSAETLARMQTFRVFFPHRDQPDFPRICAGYGEILDTVIYLEGLRDQGMLADEDVYERLRFDIERISDDLRNYGTSPHLIRKRVESEHFRPDVEDRRHILGEYADS